MRNNVHEVVAALFIFGGSLVVTGCDAPEDEGSGDDGTSCDEGLVEVDGQCMPAGNESYCGPGTILSEGVCVPIQCEDAMVLEDGACAPAPPRFSFELTEAASAYEELVEHVAEMNADDAYGHLDQFALSKWSTDGFSKEQLEFIFDHGDELSELEFKEADGAGSLSLPDGTPLASRFTRTPTGERFTGPNANSCASCHGAPISNAGGPIMANVMQDPEPFIPAAFNPRQTISMQGGGLIQILAEDMTRELAVLKQQALSNPNTDIALVVSQGRVDFGTLRCESGGTCDYTGVVGVSADLIVRPMGWKGNFPTLRGFSSDAAFGEMGMQSDEILWKLTTEPFSGDTPDFDGDDDGVSHELSVGDVTALTVYLAGQEMPTTVIALADGGLAELSDADRERIEAGRALFEASLADGGFDCASCHVTEFTISSTEFLEPSPRAGGLFEDRDLAGRSVGYTSEAPVVMDLASEIADEPRVVPREDGSAVIRPYTDLKRHFMGDHLADDEKRYFPKDASQFDVTEMPPDADAASRSQSTAIGTGEFLTPELWSVGNTGPWLHDGRALTLREAILLHAQDAPSPTPSEARASRDAFAAASSQEQDQVIAFLLNLVLVDMSEEEEEEE